MAKAKPAKKPSALLSKPKSGDRAPTKGKVIAHLAAAVSAQGLGDVSKKQAAAFLEEYNKFVRGFAPVGANLPGLGKFVVREIPAKPARTMMSFGVERQVPAKPKSKKIVFRFTKEAKEFFKK